MNKIFIPIDKLDIKNVRSQGPGGQGVNTTESKVEIRFHVASADWLGDYVKSQMAALFKNRINDEGFFILSSQQSRSRDQNLRNCLQLLRDFIEQASFKAKPRKASEPSRSSQRKRVDTKKKRGHAKKLRTQKFGAHD